MTSSETFVVTFVAGVTPTKWVGVWKERMPHIAIEVRSASAADAIEAVADRTADVAFVRVGPEGRPVVQVGAGAVGANDELSVIPLYVEQPVVVAPKDHALTAFDTVTLADLGGEILLEGEDAATVELVAANVGIAIMPQSVARAHSRRDVTARLITDAPTTRIGLAWLAEETTPQIEEFVGIVRGRTANSSRSGGGGDSDDSPRPEGQQAKKTGQSGKQQSRSTPQPRSGRPPANRQRKAPKGTGKGRRR